MSSIIKYKLLKTLKITKEIKLFKASLVTTFLAISLSISLLASLTQSTYAQTMLATSEHADINSLIKELDYLIEFSSKMQADYGKNRSSRVRFNYAALIKQLKVTRANTAAYFNETGDSIRTSPPQVLDRDLYKIK
ncbi:hypothetical protein AwWohl_01380 [Gammaproteobacteria bacterium]|nr:hypothetical protein AwWohl_01380 [Gammaproteobacteria bacterium]